MERNSSPAGSKRDKSIEYLKNTKKSLSDADSEKSEKSEVSEKSDKPKEDVTLPASPLAAQKNPIRSTLPIPKSKIPAMQHQVRPLTSSRNSLSLSMPSTPPPSSFGTAKTSTRIGFGTSSFSAKPNKSDVTPPKALGGGGGLAKPSNANTKTTPKSLLPSSKPRTGIQRRSGSIASFRSASACAQSDVTTGTLRKITSASGGDHRNKMDALEKKMVDVQTEFLKYLDSIKAANTSDDADKTLKEYKFVTCIRDDACKIMIKEDQLKKLPQDIPANSVGDFKEKITTNLTEYFTSILQQFNEGAEKPEQQESILKEIQDTSTKELGELVDSLCSNYKVDSIANEISLVQKELQQTRAALKVTENKLIEAQKEHTEALTKIEEKTKAKLAEEAVRKEELMKENQKKIKTLEKLNEEIKKESLRKAELQEELKVWQDNCHSLQKKLSMSEHHCNVERKELKAKTDKNQKLESELETVKHKFHEMQVKANNDNKNTEMMQQILELRGTVTELEGDKLTLTTKMEKMKTEISCCNDLQNKLNEAEETIQTLQKKVTESEKLLEEARKHGANKEMHMELAKLRQSDAEKRREIEKLRMELAKAMFNEDQLKAQTERDQQLLQVRSDLINSLQTNEKNYRNQIEELYAQVGEKNTSVIELNTELRNKSDEYRDLYNAINNKQLEVSSQSHMIKLLEESNQRSQILRVKQEEKISRMEQDIAHLKQTIKMYQQYYQNAVVMHY